jgi:hypothetical protein
MLAQAWIRPPSTLKCSLNSSRRTLVEQRGQKLGRDVALEQPVTVLRKGRVVPDRIVDAEPHEPAEQEVELEPLHQLSASTTSI